MPDWSYQTLLKPALFRISAAASRDLTMSRIAALARTWFGPTLIDLLGHMQAPSQLAMSAGGIDVACPVGLGPSLDPSGLASSAFARFGVGFIEIGPVTLEGGAVDDVERLVDVDGISLPSTPPSAGVEAIAANAAGIAFAQPVGFRLAHRRGASAGEAADERCKMIAGLGPRIDFVTLTSTEIVNWSSEEWRAHLSMVREALPPKTPIWLAVEPDVDLDPVAGHIDIAVELGITAIVVSGGVLDGDRRIIGAPEREASMATVAEASRRWGDRVTIVAGAGIVEPGDAVRALAAGASMVQVDAGMVYSGPGLVKRTNEAILALRPPVVDKPPASWFWLFLLGISMILGGGLATVVAMTRVVLPYDEAFIGMGPMGIRHINHHLLAFMTHDRITLAGTMLSIGVLYTMMAWFGVRRGAHWAWSAIVRSAAIGFGSFFLFLGFGYFDPLHALVSGILFVFFLLGLRDRPRGTGPLMADLVNDGAWRLALVGQLLFIAIGIGLILAGVTISGVGITRVFIPTDLMFLHTTREAVVDANAHLVPLIAHDRAGFGGALWSDGIAVLLLALWGFRRGARWVWNAFLLGGLPGFMCALGVHIAIGYMHFEHLFPVYLSIVMFTAGLTLSRRYLCPPTS